MIGSKSREKQEIREKKQRLTDEIDLYTIPEVAQIMRVTPTTIRNWIRNKQLKTIDISGVNSKQKKLRINREELERIINH